MRSVEFVPFLLTDQADIFTIRINGDSNTVLEKFLVMFKDSENKYIQRDLESILKAISNSLLILGGGGLKSTRTYEEDSSLFQHLKTLQQIDKIFRQMGQAGIDIQESVYNLTIEIE